MKIKVVRLTGETIIDREYPGFISAIIANKANLHEANLSGTDLDYASIPLQCSTAKMIVDEKIFI
jgi:uncharacterized protein YjbI with pentapeptide repeats